MGCTNNAMCVLSFAIHSLPFLLGMQPQRIASWLSLAKCKIEMQVIS